jgi:hypothetical protein
MLHKRSHVLTVVFEGPVQSGFLAKNSLTETVTGLPKSQDQKKWTGPLQTGFLRLLTGFNQLRSWPGLKPVFCPI